MEKFVNCRSKDPEVRELYIVEGDSALTSCKLGRAAEFQAIIPVRGKTLNCLKSTYDKIFKNDIIIDLLKVIGCGVEIKTKSKSCLLYTSDRWIEAGSAEYTLTPKSGPVYSDVTETTAFSITTINYNANWSSSEFSKIKVEYDAYINENAILALSLIHI